MLRERPRSYAFFLATFILFGLLAFFVERHNTWLLLACFAILFLVYFQIYRRTDEDSFTFWFTSGIIFRLIFLFATPALSDDFYRYVWDGRLLNLGYHPFAEVPSYYVHNNLFPSVLTQELYDNLNSKDYFTIYPPVAQGIFSVSAKLFPDSVYGSMIAMKSFIILAEVGTMVLLKKLTQHFGIPRRAVLLYALNPLVIAELSGNLHFEAIMIFFTLLSFYLLTKSQTIAAGASFAFAICAKLLPLILLPVLLMRIGVRKSIIFYATALAVSILLFLPLYNQAVISGFNNSLGYYFQKFEFNASIYYLVRAWGFWYYGYNIIQTIGWKLGLLSGSLILLYSLVGSRFTRAAYTGTSISVLPADWTIILLIYFLFTTTLHPWYITSLVALSVVSHFRFAIIWSALILLTYAGYSSHGFTENLWLTGLEYIIVLGYFILELTHGFRQRSFSNSV